MDTLTTKKLLQKALEEIEVGSLDSCEAYTRLALDSFEGGGKITGMTKEQITAIKCAYADLLGAYQAVIDQCDPWAHDWKDHKTSINDLIQNFSFLETMEGATQ